MQITEGLSPTPRASLAPLGYALGGAALLAVIALMHHPTGYGRNPSEVLASIRVQTTIDQLVHATLALIFSLVTAAMFTFASRLGPWRFPVTFGLVAYSCALILVVLATMNDGFIIPAVAGECGPRPSPSCMSQMLILLRMSAVQIQFLTRFSFVGVALAVLAWSAALLSTDGIPRWAGLVGLASGVLQLLALLLAASQLRPATLLPIFAGQVVWYLLAAHLMISGRGPFAGEAGSTAQ